VRRVHDILLSIFLSCLIVAVLVTVLARWCLT
jgi:hypothetical protein